MPCLSVTQAEGMQPAVRMTPDRPKRRFLPQMVGCRSVLQAVAAALLLLGVSAAAFSTVALPGKAQPEPAAFTAYIPPAEEHCCTFALPGGGVGFGCISIPDCMSVFVVAPAPNVTRYRPQARPPKVGPAPGIPIPAPGGL